MNKDKNQKKDPSSTQEKQKQKVMVGSSGAVGNGNTTAGRIFDVFNYIFLTLVAFTTIAPFIYIIGASFATEYELAQRPLLIIPHDISFNAYEYIFSTNKILSGFKNSILITVVGTLINLFFTVTMAYAISKPRLRGRNIVLNMVIFSMFFSGGMIPKVECCIDAIGAGVKHVVIMDGRVPHSILMELLTDEGAGTMVMGG